MKKWIFSSQYLIVLIWFLIQCSKKSSAVSRRSSREPSDLGVNISRILNSFFESGYDKRVRPNYGGPPVEVKVTMHIVSISSVSEVQMDFTTDFYFRQIWKDNRLQFEKRPNIAALSVGAEVAEKIWVPDTFFVNEKSAYFHVATTPNTFLRINFDGEILRSIRLTVTASCPMDLQYFPMDRQKCKIEIESYGYSMADIRYKWAKQRAVEISPNLELPQFQISGVTQDSEEISLSTGNYSRLLCEIQFVRSMGYYMIQIYVPASLIVIISWVSFWLHRNATPARVQLGVVTVLTMTTLMSSTNSQLPKISYVKSIDVFLGTCFVMVFAALLEYAAVGYIGKRISMRKNRYQQMAKLAEEKRRKLMEAEEAARCQQQHHHHHHRGGDEPTMDTLMPPPPPPPPHHLAHYATLRRSTLTSGGCPGPGPPRPSHIFHRAQDVRLEMVGSKTTSAVAQSPTSVEVGSLIPLPPPPPQLPSSGRNHHHHHHHHHSHNQHQPPPAPPPPAGFGSPLPTAIAAAATTTTSTTTANNTNIATSTTTTATSTTTTTNNVTTTTTTTQQSPGLQRFNPVPPKNLNNLFGVSPSDIDKYSRVVFPVCFVCFNLMYWIIFMHISDILAVDVGESSDD